MFSHITYVQTEIGCGLSSNMGSIYFFFFRKLFLWGGKRRGHEAFLIGITGRQSMSVPQLLWGSWIWTIADTRMRARLALLWNSDYNINRTKNFSFPKHCTSLDWAMQNHLPVPVVGWYPQVKKNWVRLCWIINPDHKELLGASLILLLPNRNNLSCS